MQVVMQGGLKTATVVVPARGGRDDGKVFHIAEMPALQAEKWAHRMFLAMKGTAGYIDRDEAARLGMVGVAIRGINAFLAAPINYADIEPLLDEMLTCVTMIRDARHPEARTALTALDVAEVSTLAWLRSEVLNLHTGFSFSEALSGLISTIKTAPGSSTT